MLENELILQGPHRLSRLCRRDLARRACKFLKRRWRDPNWHGDRLTQNRGAQIARPNSGEDVIVKLQPFPARGVLAQRNFIQCSTLIIVQNVLWQFSASRTVIIVNTEQLLRIHELC